MELKLFRRCEPFVPLRLSRLILKSLLVLIGVLYHGRVMSQNYLESFVRDLTPSPMVASLGSYGGMDVKKNTGGVAKTIGLLDVQEGNLTYSPAINYFSTGVRLDDWGSRVGIGWTENTTAVISRVVMGVADERATSRIGDGRYEFGEPSEPNYTQASYDKILSLAVNNTTVDGQHDRFSYNLFGVSGQFIIRNGQAVLLSKEQNVKIEIVQTSPTYHFVLTNANGVKYYFTSNIETTKFSSENSCDIDNPNSLGYISTAWFVNMMVSPTKDTINFEYDYREYSYIYDYSEFYIFSSIHQQYINCDEAYPEMGEKIYCIRRKNTRTYILNNVTGDNFSVHFGYVSRNDIYNERLLEKVSLMNSQGLLKEVVFSYDTIVANSTFEASLVSELSSDPWEHNSLRTRYFLKSVDFHDNLGVIEQRYGFNYEDPSILAHHFSFSRDLMGCYNGAANVGIVPEQSLKGANIPGMISIPFANRNPAAVGKAGLLNRITYPTGGVDTIIYEQNRFRTTVVNEHKSSYYDWISCEEWPSYSGAFFEMYVPITSPVELKIECYYDSDEPPTQPEEEYWADVELWSTEGRMTFPNGQTKIEFRPNQTFFSTTDDYFGINRLTFYPENEYWLQVNIYGKHTTLRATLEYISSITNDVVDSAFVGHRIKKVISRSSTGQDVVRTYNYNRFQRNADTLAFTDIPSTIVAPANKFRVTGANECYRSSELGFFYQTYRMYRLLSQNNYDINIFGGLPYAYSHVTEFLDSSQISFIASEFTVLANGYGGRIFGGEFAFAEPVLPQLESSAWDHGQEIKRFYGGKQNNTFQVIRENRWSYSAETDIYYNYSASKLKPIHRYFTSPADNIGEYMVSVYSDYSHWVKLDTLTEINYFRTGSGYNTISNKITYRYNTSDKLTEEEETAGSKGDVLLKQIIRPHKMVALGRDPNSIYQGMINNHIIAPEVEVVNKRNASQVNLVRTNYYQPFSALYVPQSIQTQQAAADPLVTQLKYLRYDSKGNVLSLSREGGPAVNYIWSYKGRYPVAKVENCDYNTIESTLGATAIANFRGLYPAASNIETLISPLRTAVPKAFITRYTYNPLVGMTSMMDPKGQITSYEYDSFQRLKVIKDHYGNILKNFEYHYNN